MTHTVTLTFLGAVRTSEALAHRIEAELGICAVVPRLGERVRLTPAAGT
jgi:hypothetical protein